MLLAIKYESTFSNQLVQQHTANVHTHIHAAFRENTINFILDGEKIVRLKSNVAILKVTASDVIGHF